MQLSSTQFVTCRSCEGAAKSACQGQNKFSPRKRLSVRQKSSIERRWTSALVSARKPPLHLSHQRDICRCAAGSGSSEDSVTEQRKKLEALFSASSVDSSAGPETEAEDDPLDDPAGQIIRNLPLWRVQWTALPGTQEILHVHVPHYCHMFESIVAGPKPWRFGHLYLPGGSASLGNEAYALKPGTDAPLVGTLMEVVKVLRCPDGRLIVLAAGLGRIKALRQQQAIPYSRADVELLPDEEENAEWQPLIDHVLTTIAGDASLLSVMMATSAAGHAAAIASAEVWQQYAIERHVALEFADEAVEDASLDTVRLTRQVQSIELVEPLLALPLQGEQATSPDSGWCERLGAVRVAAAEAAQLAATRAANSITQSGRGEPTPEGVVYSERRMSMNSTWQRGVQTEGSEVGLSDEASELLDGDSADVLLSVRQLEALVWNELDAIAVLAQRLQRGSPQLPTAFRSFRPAPAEQRGPSTPEASSPFAVVLSDDGSSQSDPVSIGSLPISSESEDDAQDEESPSTSEEESDPIVEPAESSFTEGDEQDDGDGSPEPSGVPLGSDSSGDGYASREFPPLLRAQRLSYALAMILHNISAAEGRQALLEAPSIESRFKLGLTALRKHRKVLAALSSLKSLEDM